MFLQLAYESTRADAAEHNLGVVQGELDAKGGGGNALLAQVDALQKELRAVDQLEVQMRGLDLDCSEQEEAWKEAVAEREKEQASMIASQTDAMLTLGEEVAVLKRESDESTKVTLLRQMLELEQVCPSTGTKPPNLALNLSHSRQAKHGHMARGVEAHIEDKSSLLGQHEAEKAALLAFHNEEKADLEARITEMEELMTEMAEQLDTQLENQADSLQQGGEEKSDEVVAEDFGSELRSSWFDARIEQAKKRQTELDQEEEEISNSGSRSRSSSVRRRGESMVSVRSNRAESNHSLKAALSSIDRWHLPVHRTLHSVPISARVCDPYACVVSQDHGG